MRILPEAQITIHFTLLYILAVNAIQLSEASTFNLPEIYQDVLIKGQVKQFGIRKCSDRYEAIKTILSSLPRNFKSLDIGASQGYFSFRMAEEFKARCTLIEDSYTITDVTWATGDYLHYLCEQNSHLSNLTLLQKRVFATELKQLYTLEKFDVVLAFSVVHHMKKKSEEPHETYIDIIDALLQLAPVVLIETPVNTGDHTLFIQKILQEKNGRLLYQSYRDTLLYEIYVFDRRTLYQTSSVLPSISMKTYRFFNGTYPIK